MITDISQFELNIDNAKEFFFLNDCKISYIDRNGLANSKKFRELSIDEATLTKWTNEWLNSKIKEVARNKDVNTLLRILDDYSNRIDSENTVQLISLYKELMNDKLISKELEIKILYHIEEPVLLDKRFEFGLIYLLGRNNLTLEYKYLLDRFITLNSTLHLYDDSTIMNIMNDFSK